MSAQQVYDQVLAYAQEFDPEFAALLAADPAYAQAIFAIGRGGKKPRKDLTTWKEAKPYMGFFYDPFFDGQAPFPEQFAPETVAAALRGFLQTYDRRTTAPHGLTR